MFYHSFPRPPRGGPIDEEKGLKILESILKSGLLLVPEVVVYPLEYGDGNGYRLVQSRFCLTQLDDLERLERHAEHFGTFHLEFSDKTIYFLGAIPVMYLPKRSGLFVAGSASLADLGGFFIHRLLELQDLCTRIKQLKQLLLENSFNETITVGDKKDRTAETYTLNVRQAKAVLDLLGRDIESFDRIQGALQGFASLFYPIEMDHPDGETNKPYHEQLYFFRQREWRVIRGVKITEQTIDMELSEEERDTLLKIDPVFYGPGEKELEFINGRKPKICGCSVIRELEGRPVWEKIDYIIVPAAKLEAARELAKRYTVNGGKIVDMETRKAIKAKTDAQKQPGAVKRSEGK